MQAFFKRRVLLRRRCGQNLCGKEGQTRENPTQPEKQKLCRRRYIFAIAQLFVYRCMRENYLVISAVSSASHCFTSSERSGASF